MGYSEEGTITLKMLVQDLASGKVGAFIGKLDTLAQKGGLVGSVAQGVGQSFGQMLNPLGALTKGIGFVTDVMGDAISAASDLNESQSKATVVFGDSMDAIDKWADHSADAMGASKQAALEMAGTLGNLFTALDLSQEAAAGMSMDAVQLAADLASFNNLAGGTEEALDKIRSGLVGESEPLRSLGVNLTEAGVAAEAVALGLADSTKSVSSAAKVQARWSLIVKQSKNAAGDFARTSDGMANSQRILDAEMANVSAEIGTALLPAMEKLGKMAKDYLVPALQLIPDALKLIDESGAAYAATLDRMRQAGNDLALRVLADAGDWLKMESVLADKMGMTAEAMASELTARMKDVTLTQQDAIAQVWTEVKEGRFVPAAKAVGAAGGKAFGDGATGALTVASGRITEIVHQVPSNIADELNGGVSEVKAASRALKNAILNPTKPVESLATLRGIAFGKNLRNGLKSQDRYVRKQATITALTVSGQFNTLAESGYLAGYGAGQALIDGLRASGALDNGLLSQFGYGGATEYKPPKGGRPGWFAHASKKRQQTWLRNHPHRALGGPVNAGGAYLVGENGPELLQMGSQSGNVVANGKVGGHTFIYSPQFSTASPIEAQRFAQSILPELRRLGYTG